uniref:Uncharacterized protein n=1 Tax=Arundo donax TaxID=35708 RepID=A0A0A8Y572_ARUDO
MSTLMDNSREETLTCKSAERLLGG